MEKQTKQTLKVLSTLALASTVTLAVTGTVDAKSYKPEVRYDGKDYFVKTSDPEAVGKQLYFTTDISNQPKSKYPVAILYDYSKYNGEELNISENLKTGSLGETFTRDTPFSIVDDEIPTIDSTDDEETKNKKVEKFVKSAVDGFTTVNKLSKVEKSTESTQPTRPAQPTVPAGPEQPAQPTGPAQPVQPAGPEQPAQPTGPEKPAQPTGPKEPAQPAGPAQPAQPTGPVQPAGPAQPAQPARPKQPVQPVQPAGPAQPVQPAGAEQPVQPAGPAQPAQPKKSELSEIVGAGEAQNNPKGGQLETPNKDDKKVESTIKSEGKVNAKKALPNTGLQTSSYVLLGSIIGLVSIMALRRKKSK